MTVSPMGAGPTASPSLDPERAPHSHAIASVDLFRGGRELIIIHRHEQYRLRITRAGKLILTK